MISEDRDLFIRTALCKQNSPKPLYMGLIEKDKKFKFVGKRIFSGSSYQLEYCTEVRKLIWTTLKARTNIHKPKGWEWLWEELQFKFDTLKDVSDFIDKYNNETNPYFDVEVLCN